MKWPYIFEGITAMKAFYEKLQSLFTDVGDDMQEQKTRVDNLINGAEQPSEVVDMRLGRDSQTYPVARDMVLGEIEKTEAAQAQVNQDTAAQLADEAQQRQDVDSSLQLQKANKLNLVITVSKGNSGDFNTIMDAVNFANANFPNDQVTILIGPGTYNENVHVGGQAKISLIGVNKKFCIIQLDQGLYNSQPLEIEGNCYVANLTIVNTHDQNPNQNIEDLRGYALHADWAGTGHAEFFNCLFISYQNAAVGSGLHTNQALDFKSCEFMSFTPVGASMLTNGAFFCHNDTDPSAVYQSLTMNDCYCYSQNGYSMYINDANFTVGDGQGNSMKCQFTNVRLMSDALYIEDSLHVDVKPTNNNFSGCIELSWDSLGNNCSKLNHNSNWWISPQFVDGISNFYDGWQPLSYAKARDGFVSITGMIKGVPTSGSIIFTLPVGYRPKYLKKFPCVTNDGTTDAPASIVVKPTGEVQIDNMKSGFTAVECNFLADI
jgi:hypothetical protein